MSAWDADQASWPLSKRLMTWRFFPCSMTSAIGVPAAADRYLAAGLLLAEAPPKNVKTLDAKLSAELAKTAGVKPRLGA
jgi:hypothetical protein